MRFSANQVLRPVRIGFLTNPNDLVSLRKILRLNACLWGGIYNPIIPTFKRLPKRWNSPVRKHKPSSITSGYIRFFEPDLLVEATPGLAEGLGWKDERHSFDFDRIISLDEFVSTDSYGRTNFGAGVDISDVFAHLYHENYKFRLKTDEPFAIVKETDARSLFFDAFIGCFPNDEKLRPIGEGFEKAFAPLLLKQDAASFLSLMESYHHTPFGLGKYKLKAEFIGPGELTFFVLDPSDGQDVIDYWNLRQIERPVIPINVHWIAQCMPYLFSNIQANFRPLPGNPNGIMIHTNIEFARSILEDVSQNIMQATAAAVSPGAVRFNKWYHPIWEERDDQWSDVPLRASISAGLKTIDAIAPIDENSINFTGISPSFIGEARKLGKATWINVIKPGTIFTDEKLATVYPNNIKAPSFPRLNLGGVTVVTREGWLFPQRYENHSDYIRVQKGQDAFVDWFQTQEVVATPSDAGRVAEQIVNSAGGLRGCAIFANQPTIELLDSMAVNRRERTTPEGQSFDEHFPDKSVPIGRWEQLFKKESSSRRLPWITLEKFIEASVLRAGLQIKCIHCAQKNWYDVKALDFELTCARCLRKFLFPQSAQALKEMKWFYRVIGPFATPGYAEGGYTVALALRLFTKELGGILDAASTWTTGLDLKFESKTVEVDFALWHQQKRMFGEQREPSLLFGEAKSFAERAFSDDDIERMKFLAERYPGSYMVAAMLKSQLSNSDRTKLTKLARWGRNQARDGVPPNRLIILTGVELFSEWRLLESWKNAGGRAAQFASYSAIDISHLPSFAEMTQSIYLGLPSVAEDMQKRHARKIAKIANKAIESDPVRIG